MKIGIQGAGIAGTTLAYWLYHFGHEPVLIEQSPELRKGGYLIDFWGIGYDIAEKMGLLPELKKRGYPIEKIHWKDNAGKTQSSFDVDIFRGLANNRYLSIERSELAAAIYELIGDKVEIVFGDSISVIKETDKNIQVSFEKSSPQNFDLLIGADGLHSNVRELVFGPISLFEKCLGLRIAAVEVQGYKPRDKNQVIGHTQPGRLIFRVSKRKDKTLFLLGFLVKLEKGKFPATDGERKAVLGDVYKNMGWEAPQILNGIDRSETIYYDKVSQIVMKRWSKGRVALLGDAAASVSLLAGEGAGLAMAEAYVLAGEIARADQNFSLAFDRYENRLKKFVEGKQNSALKVATTFIPVNKFQIFLRNLGLKILPGSWVVKLGLGKLIDDIDLPIYEKDRKYTSTETAL